MILILPSLPWNASSNPWIIQINIPTWLSGVYRLHINLWNHISNPDKDSRCSLQIHHTNLTNSQIKISSYTTTNLKTKKKSLDLLYITPLRPFWWRHCGRNLLQLRFFNSSYHLSKKRKSEFTICRIFWGYFNVSSTQLGCKFFCLIVRYFSFWNEITLRSDKQHWSILHTIF